MLFDIGWSELLLIGVIALVVIGPKDLPRALRVAGYWVRKARGLSREFHNSVEQMIREAELDEMRQELKKAADFNIGDQLQKTIDPTGSLSRSLAPPTVPDFFEKPPAVSEMQPRPTLAPAPQEAAPGLPVAEPPPVQGFETPPGS
ncbi:MAG: twin-arginine translocase subunit TatB [Alphaproteobacteria bacterium]|nr:twin-arginine translocase subunit TatB [Alphaproteobacteria bacterium]